MGNWHCIPSSCATVHYREYLAPKIRWRYPNEPWQEIEGDDYSTNVKTGQLYGVLYRIKGQALEMPRPSFNRPCKNPVTWQLSNNFLGKIISVDFYTAVNQPIQAYVVTESVNGQRLGIWNYLYWTTGQFAGTSAYMYYALTCSESNHVLAVSGVSDWQANRIDNLPDNGDCIFTIIKNGQTVYTETRAVCPEVEKIPCSLSDVNKQIEIDKLPYLERVEVTDYDYENFGANVFRRAIPPECLVIRNTGIATIIPLPGGIPTPSNSSLEQDFKYGFVSQICSAVGCPPPEYNVICDCDCNNCESCPDGTCAVECDGQICCYGSDGISVKTIALTNYCGGQS